MKLYTTIKKISFLFMLISLFPLWVFGQASSVEGIVISASGKALQNVKITVKENPNTEAYTDEKGSFTITAEAGQHLVAEDENKARKIVAISKIETQRKVVLDRKSELVDVGFNTRQRSEEIASSVGSVSGEELNVTTHTAGNALFGQLSGLRMFQNTGIFPSYRHPGMNIRGQATTRNNSILVLVDGVERSLNTIVPEEIEDVTVLRDAAAKAKFGQRGANGVLLVTTKRGSVGKAQYNFSFEQGLTQPVRVPQFLGAPAYANAVNEAMKNDGLTSRYSQTDIHYFQSGDYPAFWPNVNWVDQTLADWGQFSRFNFNTSGGNEIASYHVNLNYQNDHGLYKYTEAFEDFSTQLDYDKVNFRTNLDVNLTPTTLAQINLAGYIESRQRPKVWDIVGDAFEIPSALFPVKNFDGSWGGTNQFGNNPVAELSDTGYNLAHERSILSDIRLEQNLNSITEGLSAELFAAFDNQTDYWENKNKTYTYKEVIPVVDAFGAIVDTLINELGEDSDLSPSRRSGNLQSSHYDLRGKLKYTKSFDKHAFDGWVLFQQEQQEIRGTNNKYRRRNFVGNVHYGLADKYFLDATISYYGTNRIRNKSARYGLFPAIGGAWAVSKEAFMSDVNFISDLKLKASYGKVGNGRIPMHNFIVEQYGWVGNAYVFGHNHNSTSGREESQIPIESKKFESSYEFNVGFESQLFSKLDLNLELFHTKRKNIFVPSGGLYSEVIGIIPSDIPNGVVENKGYELDMTWRDHFEDFAYYVTGRLSQYQNKIININEEHRPYDYMKREGQPVGQYFGWESDGFYADENEIQNSPVSQFGIVRPGDIKYVDQNGDNIIDEFDQKPIGRSSTPEIYYSFNLGLEYKGFHVSALFQGTERSSTYLNQAHVFWPLRSSTGNISTWYDNYWSENNQTGATLPRLTTKSNNNNFRPNDIWIRDNSFLKLRYAEVSYSLPTSLIADLGLGLRRVNIYLRGRNLYSFDKINYVDPENPGAHYPALRAYNAGINVTF